jgi:hypothetical protein
MRSFVLAALCAGCFSSILDQDPQAVPQGGKVQAGLSGGVLRITPAVAHQKGEPMVVEGASTELTFSLTAADTLGGTALADLKNAGDQTQLNLRKGGRNHLEIHLDGGGCVAVTGLVSLSLDSNTRLAGSFDADGTLSGGTTPCHMSGTLAEIPLDR